MNDGLLGTRLDLGHTLQSKTGRDCRASHGSTLQTSADKQVSSLERSGPLSSAPPLGLAHYLLISLREMSRNRTGRTTRRIWPAFGGPVGG